LAHNINARDHSSGLPPDHTKNLKRSLGERFSITMKLLGLFLPILGTLALAQVASNHKCQCPQIKCPAKDALALCECINNRERACKKVCPEYAPRTTTCVSQPTTEPTKALESTPSSTPCVCEPMACPQIWPGSCVCANGIAQRCYEKCGGPVPVLLPCPLVPEVTPIPTPVSDPVSGPVASCTCEKVMCIDQFPESCYCANAAAQRCYKKCGGKKPAKQKCPPREVKTLTTKLQTKKPMSTSTQPPLPLPTHKPCGGGRANQFSCDKGETCIPDPDKPGCGPPCDGLGICVKDEICGGFAGFPCKVPGQVCRDDPRDDCDPDAHGADCAGLCVWPHTSLPQR